MRQVLDYGDGAADGRVRPLAQRSKPNTSADLSVPVASPMPREAELAFAMTHGNSPTVAARREFALLLGEFRRTPLLVPLDKGAACGLRT